MLSFIKKFFILMIMIGSDLYSYGQTQPLRTPSSDTPIYIDIGSAGVRRFRLAIVPFLNTDQKMTIHKEDLAKCFEKLNKLFSFMGSFEILPPFGFLAKSEAPMRPMIYEEWRAIKAEGVIFGKFVPSPEGLKLEMQFFLVNSEKRVVGKSWKVDNKDSIGVILLRFVDLCINELTGELGIFSTKIAFVAAKKPGDAKQLYMANFGTFGTNYLRSFYHHVSVFEFRW